MISKINPKDAEKLHVKSVYEGIKLTKKECVEVSMREASLQNILEVSYLNGCSFLFP